MRMLRSSNPGCEDISEAKVGKLFATGNDFVIHAMFFSGIGVLTYVFVGILRKGFAFRYYSILKRYFPRIEVIIPRKAFFWLYVFSTATALAFLVAMYTLFIAVKLRQQ